MARKKGKVSMKKNIDGDGSAGGGGGSDPNACVFSASRPVVLDFSGSGGEISASKAIIPATNHDQAPAEKCLMERFYEKLVKLHQPTGLSVVFNFRETMLDLYLLYKKVTERGGFYQVSKEGKWNEVASVLNLKMQVLLLPSQVQKIYGSLLVQYEQMHYYRTPAKVYTTPGLSSDCANRSECSLGKRKSCDNSSQDDQVAKKNVPPDAYQASTGPRTPEQKSNIQIPLGKKDMIKDPDIPLKPRTAYQLFVKTECERLRKIHGESSGNMSYRNMATEGWKHLSQCDRLPYIEASRKDKDRFNRDMIVYEQIWNQKIAKRQNLLSNSTPSMINFGPSSPIDDGYYVTLEADAGNFFVPNESFVESTIQMLKNSRPNDPMFEINWDGCVVPQIP